MRTSNDIEAIKATEIIKQYCRDVSYTVGCTDCIFNYYGGCILHNNNDYDRHDYIPHNWHIDLIKED